MITKDELRILAVALNEAKYELIECLYSKEDRNKGITALDNLSEKISELYWDKRRTGRTSQDDFSDCLRRLIKKNGLSNVTNSFLSSFIHGS